MKSLQENREKKLMNFKHFIAVLGIICLTVSAHALYVDENTHPAYLKKPLPEYYKEILKETSFCLPEGVLIDSCWVMISGKLQCLA